MEHWLSEAQKQEDVLYFSILPGKDLIGQILLHDLNLDAGESLVAYHLFDPQLRGQGYGTMALRLLEFYVMQQAELKKVIIILPLNPLLRNVGFNK
jgi:RimJ/RimL family protein N-acetyltransferase